MGYVGGVCVYVTSGIATHESCLTFPILGNDDRLGLGVGLGLGLGLEVGLGLGLEPRL